METPSVLGIDKICLDYLHSREAHRDYGILAKNNIIKLFPTGMR